MTRPIRPVLAAATLAVLAIAAPAAPAAARTLTFKATLGGIAPPTVTGSPASGRATIRVDTSTQRVSIDLDVTGIAPDQLSKAWIAKPAGPVALHDYRGADDWDAVSGFAWGADYRAARGGFHVSARNVDFAAVAKALDAGLDFDGFVNGLRAGRIVVVVHTERFAGGEIGGRTREN